MIYLNPVQFLKTVYFGDRFCTELVIDSNNNRVELHVNQVSRIRDTSGEWNYYSDEDVENGAIVITGVQKITFDESGLFPNDQIYDVYAIQISEGIYEFVIETSYVDEKALTHDLTFKIIGEGVYIFDPTRPNIKITE